MGCIIRIIKKCFSSIIWSLPLLKRPYLVNSYILRDCSGKQCCANWGDDLNGNFLSSIVDGKIYDYGRSPLAYRFRFVNYLVIGSTIDLRNTFNQIIWGAGIIKESSILKCKPKKVCAVRGPKTRDVLLRQGIDCPEIYGDPALLMPYYYKPKKVKKYKWGIISHNSNEVFISNLFLNGIKVGERDDVLVISMKCYENWKDVPDAICSCENILSSSLHGLIMSEAYKIPSVWIEFGKPLYGGRFKFYDFYESIQKKCVEPIVLANSELPIVCILDRLSKWKCGEINLHPLLETSPFKLKKFIYND